MIIHPETTVALTFDVEDGDDGQRYPVLRSAKNENDEDQLPAASPWQVARWELQARQAMEDQGWDGVVARWERCSA